MFYFNIWIHGLICLCWFSNWRLVKFGPSQRQVDWYGQPGHPDVWSNSGLSILVPQVVPRKREHAAVVWQTAGATR